jgi:hypothetical protein
MLDELFWTRLLLTSGIDRLVHIEVRIFYVSMLLYLSHSTCKLGLALARFELSALAKHSGDHVIVIRILKFTQPVTHAFQNYDGRIPFPREGELFHRKQQPYTIRLDKDNSNSQVLKRLVEDYLASPMSSPPPNEG